MCWRIVRVQGDGTVKLILIDEQNDCKNYTQRTEDDDMFVIGTKDFLKLSFNSSIS